MLVLVALQQFQIVAETQVEAQFGQRDVGLAQQGLRLRAVGGFQNVFLKPQRGALHRLGQHEPVNAGKLDRGGEQPAQQVVGLDEQRRFLHGWRPSASGRRLNKARHKPQVSPCAAWATQP